MADVVHNAGVVCNGIIGGNVQHIAVVHSILGHRCHIVGIGEGVLGAGVAQILQVALNGVYLIFAVWLSGAVQQTHGLCIGAPLVNHICLLIQRSQIGSTGYVGTHGAGEVINAQSHAVLGHCGAQNGNITGCGGGCLQCGGCVCQHQVHALGNKAVHDGCAGCGIAGCVLLIELHLIAQSLHQSVFKALGCSVQCHVGRQLADANQISFLVLGCGGGFCCGIIAAGCQRQGHCGCTSQCHQFLFHCAFSYFLITFILMFFLGLFWSISL